MINEDDLKLIRPADGLKPTELDAVIGTKTRSNLSAGDPITWADLYIKE
jgi:Sialic acid synthase